MIQHPVFIRRTGKKTIITTIIDSDLLTEYPPGDIFVTATTGESPMKDGLTITLPIKEALASEVYVETVAGTHEDTRGTGIDGILKRPYWFVRKFKSIVEMMGV